MEGYFVLLPVALSSAALVWLGRRRGWPLARLRAAAVVAAECVGLTVALLVVNTVVGGAAALLARRLSGQFVSLYLITDSVLLGLSALQAVALRWWMRE